MTGAATHLVVVVSQRLGSLGAEEHRIADAGAELRSAPLWSVEEATANALDADVIVLGAVEPFDADMLGALTGLKAIVRRGVGTDNVDIAAATELGIIVANVPDASVEEVSDHALALLLSIERAVPWLDRAVRDGKWGRDPAQVQAVRARTRQLRQLTVGVMGLGRIGLAFAAKVRPLYGELLGSDPFVSSEVAAERGITLVSTDELLKRADHVSLHAPLLPTTRHLINRASIARMRPGAVLVNTSRGGLVDADAVLEAVSAGRLGGAGLDVTDPEPLPADSPLLATDRILVTAHSAASSTAAAAALARRSVDAAVAFVRGQAPDSIVNPEVLQSVALRMQTLRHEGTSR